MNPLLQYCLANVKTIEDARHVWRAHRTELKDCALVLATSQPSPFHFPARMNLPGDGFLRSVFNKDYLHFLTDELIDRKVCGKTKEIKVSYCVSFDSNAASYRRGLAIGRPGNAVQRLLQTIRCLGPAFGAGGFRWDYFPFLLERANAIIEGRDMSFVFETVVACERLAACQRGEFRHDQNAIEQIAKSQIESWKQGLHSGLSRMIQHRLNLFYIFALKAIIIHLKRPSPQDAPAKLQELLEFLGNSIGCLLQLIASAALEFFTNGHKFRPFQKVASRKPDLKKDALNVAWDFLHLQIGHELTGFHGMNGPFLVRYFLTFDRPLAELFDSFPQRSCLICPDRHSPLFFADFDFPSQVVNQFPELWPVIAKHFKLGGDQHIKLVLERKLVPSGVGRAGDGEIDGARSVWRQNARRVADGHEHKTGSASRCNSKALSFVSLVEEFTQP